VVLDQKVMVPDIGFAILSATFGEMPLPPDSQLHTLSGVQTFTAGTAGILDHIDFQAYDNSPSSPPTFLKLSLIDGDYTAGARNVLISAEISSETLPDKIAARTGVLGLSFNTSSAGYAVTSGQHYSVLFEAIPSKPTNIGVIIGYAINQPFGTEYTSPDYAGGEWSGIKDGVIEPTPPIPNWGPFNAGFASYVLQADTGAVPEPASWVLMIAGFGAIGGVLRSQSQRRLRHA
jgi:hypothetical protein